MWGALLLFILCGIGILALRRTRKDINAMIAAANQHFNKLDALEARLLRLERRLEIEAQRLQDAAVPVDALVQVATQAAHLAHTEPHVLLGPLDLASAATNHQAEISSRHEAEPPATASEPASLPALASRTLETVAAGELSGLVATAGGSNVTAFESESPPPTALAKAAPKSVGDFEAIAVSAPDDVNILFARNDEAAEKTMPDFARRGVAAGESLDGGEMGGPIQPSPEPQTAPLAPRPSEPTREFGREPEIVACAATSDEVVEFAPSEQEPVESASAESIEAAAPELIAEAATGMTEPEAVAAFETPVPEPAPGPRDAPAPCDSQSSRIGALAQVGQRSLRELARAGRSPSDWETLIGGRWLNLIGMIVLVIGVVLLSQQALLYLGPRGKVALGAAFGVLALAAGVVFERREVYRRVGRTLVGGGWALLYFDAFAASNLEQARIIDNAAVGLAIMAATAAGMVAHSLRYRSQFVTSVSFGLGYLAVVLTPVTLASLIASTLLATALAVVAWALAWRYLLASGVIAAYSLHWFWLQKVYDSDGTALPVFTASQGFWLSTAVIVFYWALFAFVSLTGRLESENERRVHLSVSVSNAVGMLGLITLQLMQGYGGHYLAFLAGSASLGYVVVARGERRLGARAPFLFASTLAAALYAATLPLARYDYEIDAGWIAPVLTLGALLTMAAGARTQELLLRGEGYALSLAALAMTMYFNLAPPHAPFSHPLWYAAPGVAAAFQIASEAWRRRWLQAGGGEYAGAALAFGVGATGVVAYLLWGEIPRDVIGPVWLALALSAFEISVRLRRGFVRVEAYVLAGLAFLAIMALNLGPLAPQVAATAPRLLLVAASIGGFFYLSWRLMAGRCPMRAWEAIAGWLPSALACVLVVPLVWLEAPRPSVTAAYSLGGLLLFEVGAFARRASLRNEGYALLVLGALAVAAFNGAPAPVGTAQGLATYGFAALTLTALWRVYARTEPGPALLAQERKVSIIASAAAAALAAELLGKLLPSEFVALSWLALAAVLFEIGARIDRRTLRWESYALQIFAAFWLLSVDHLRATAAAQLAPQLLVTAACAAFEYYFTWRLLWGRWNVDDWERQYGFGPSVVGSFLVVLMAGLDLDRGLTTAALAFWGLVLFETGRLVDRRSIRWQGEALFALAFFAAAIFNGLAPPFGTAHGFASSWGPVALTIAILAWRCRRGLGESAVPWLGAISDHTSAAATLLLAQILYKETPVDVVGVAWLAAGLLMFEISAKVERPAFRIESYALTTFAFAALLLVNVNPAMAPMAPTVPGWALTWPAAAAFYYLYWRLRDGVRPLLAFEPPLNWLPSAAATTLVALAICAQFAPLYVTAAVSLSGVVLFEIGMRARLTEIRVEAYALVAFGLGAAFAVNGFGLFQAAHESLPGRLAEGLPAAICAGAAYWLFYRLALFDSFPGEAEKSLAEPVSGIATLLLAFLLWKETPALAVALGWGALGLLLFELSFALAQPVLRLQAHLLLASAYVRLFMANLLINDTVAGLPVRLVSVVPVLCALYYVIIRIGETATERKLVVALKLSEAYSYGGFFLIAALCRFEFGRAHTVAAWSLAVLVFLILGERLRRRDFRYQSYGLALYSVFRAWSTNIYLDGQWLGMPERISTTLPMIAVLFVAALAFAAPEMARKPAEASVGIIPRALSWLDARSRGLFAVLASAFVAILLLYQLSINTVSIGWALQGFSLLTLGFAFNSRVFRLFGLGLLFVCLIKVTFFDLAGVETIYRILSFIVLGLLLLLASLGYARYRDKLERLI